MVLPQKTVGQIATTYHNGDHLTDDELVLLNAAAAALANAAGLFGPTASMAHAYAIQIRNNTEDYMRARLDKPT